MVTRGLRPHLVTRAAMAMGFKKDSLLRLHADAMYKNYLAMNPKTAGPWAKLYKKSAQEIMYRMAREPQSVQDLMHNHILKQTVGQSQTKQALAKQDSATVMAFVNNLWREHNRIARYYGIESTLPAPPTDKRPTPPGGSNGT